MITADQIQQVNKQIKTIKLRGKDYAMVKDRVTAFRDICPNWTITTELLSNVGGVAVFKATIEDPSGRVLATGHAFEVKDSNQINNTSYIENCETSAIGRALSALGIGIDSSYASAEELTQAITNQDQITEDDWKTLRTLYEKRGLNPSHCLMMYPLLTKEQYNKIVKRMDKIPLLPEYAEQAEQAQL